MGKTVVVKPGDTLSSLAARHGFADFRTVFDDPGNAALKSLRKNPHTLVPGDEVFIPDREDRQESAPTDTRTTFVAQIQGLFLRVKVLDFDNRKLDSDAVCLLSTTGTPQELNPDGDGIVESPIRRDLEKAELRVAEKELKFDLLIGQLQDINTLAGQRARLNNLGYFAGFMEDDVEQFRWGAEEFNKDKKVQPMGVKKTDVDPEAGLTRGAFLAKLEKEHGS